MIGQPVKLATPTSAAVSDDEEIGMRDPASSQCRGMPLFGLHENAPQLSCIEGRPEMRYQ